MDDLEQLRRLKDRYLRTLDLNQWDEFAQTLAPDVQASYGEGLDFTGRDAVVEFMRGSPARGSSPCTTATIANSTWTGMPRRAGGTCRTP